MSPALPISMVSLEQLSEIHAQFRRQMNADVAQALRKHGVIYRTCFGVPSMRLREVAERYTPSTELAEALWKEDIRESKMLATRLYPPTEMTLTTALRWISEIRYEEIADQACMNLFAHLPIAVSLLEACLLHTKPQQVLTVYCGLKLAARLHPSQLPAEILQPILQTVTQYIETATQTSLRTAAYWAKENLMNT